MPIQSRLDPANLFVYPETRRLRSADKGESLDTYKIKLLNIPVTVIIGLEWRPVPSISAFPIYLLGSDKKGIQVGVFEQIASDNTELELTAEMEPLLYTFVTREFIHKQIKPNSQPQPIDIPEPVSIPTPTSTHPTNKKMSEKGQAIKSESEIETAEISRDIREKYHIRPSEDTWIQKYMKNRNYTIHDVEGNGDCFFAVIRDALDSIDIHVTVNGLRQQVADEATEEIFNTYRELYDMYANRLQEITAESRTMKQQMEKYKGEMTTSTNDKERSEKYIHALETQKTYKALRKEHEFAKANIADVKFMKPIHTLVDFRAYIQTSQFWADSWAIGVVERMQSVKSIIFSSLAYYSKDLEQVLRCNAADSVLEARGEFRPRTYIMMEYTGQHYKNIAYKGRTACTFLELPYDVKTMAINKCLEKESGVFALIPDFIEMKNDLEQTKKSKAKAKSKTKKGGGRGGDQGETYTKNAFILSTGVYTSGIRLVFYDNSSDKPLPGKGTGEEIPLSLELDFVELYAVPQWRKKLSDQWNKTPFEKDGHMWMSVEHYVQASKFKQLAHDFYLQFTQESKTPLSKNPCMAIAAGSKKGKYKHNRVRPANIRVGIIDKSVVRRRALEAKFGPPHEDLVDMLIATRNAQLMIYQRGKPAEPDMDLMWMRDELIKNKK